MNKSYSSNRQWIANFVSSLALLVSATAMASTSDTYSIDEDSLLSVAAPGVLLNDIVPIGTDPLGSVVAAVNLTPTSAVGVDGSTTFPGNLGGAGRPFRMNANGSFTYDPRGRFDFLAAGESYLDVSSNAAGATTRYFNNPNNGIVLVTITVTGRNDTPTDIALSANAVSENAGPNVVVGGLSTTDVDNSDTHTYSLVSGTGDVLNDSFKIVGSNLVTKGGSVDADQSTPRTVRIRTTDNNGGQYEEVFTINVTPVAAAPNVASTATLTPNEDVAVNLGLSASLNDTTDETLTLVISGLPSGATLSDGVNTSSSASTDVTAWNLANVTVQSKLHDDSDFTLTVTATAQEAVNGNTAQATSTTNVNVVAVADAPGLSVTGAVSGNEDSAIALTINGSLVDVDGSETLTYRISGVPTGATLNNGTNAGSGNWNLSAADVAGLTITPPLHDASAFAISVTATTTETTGGDTASSPASVISATVTPVADAPTLTVNNASGNEDTAIALSISAVLVDTDSSEIIDGYQITGVPTGAVLNQGTDAGAGVWNLTAGQVAGLTVTPKLHDDTNFNLSVAATTRETSNGDTATANGVIAVTVNAVADAPTVSVTNTAAGNEDTAIALTIGGALVDTDGSETLSFRISDVPTGASLNNGTDAGGGVWNITAAGATGLTLTPKLHDDSDFTLTVAAVATEGANSNEALTTATIDVTVTAVVDTPNFSAPASISGSEDIPITIGVTSSLVDTDGSETLTLQVTGVPTGATLNNGTDAGAGVWNLVESDLSGLTILNKLHDDSDFSITVTATATETNDGSSVTLPAANIAVTVLAVADAPTISVTSSVTKDEDSGPVPLTIAADLVDTDGSESMTYQISGVLASATLSAGVNQGGGVWNLTEAQAEAGLTLTMDTHVAETFQIDVRALATEVRDGSTQFSAPGAGRINIFITPKADEPSITVNPLATGNEDTPIPLTISGDLTDLDGSETLTMIITGHPAGSTFSAGSDLGSGSWGVDVSDLAGLTITPAANNNDDFTLTVTSTARETANGDTATKSDTISVQVQAVNDAPSLAPFTFVVDENSPNGTIVGTVTATDVEPVGSELAQSFTYEIAGTAFSIDNGGVIRVADVAQLDAETISQFTPQVTARDSGLPSLSAVATVTINLNGIDDNVPEAVDDAVSVDEQDSVNFDVVANDTDADTPAQTLFVAEVNGDVGLVGVPTDISVDGVVVGALTVNGDGSATFVTTSEVTVEKFAASATYRVTDGDTPSVNEGTINITINPRNDNQPILSAAGLAAEADGLTFEEDQYPSISNSFTVIVNNLFQDLDIDADGLLDSNTGEDNDSLNFDVIANSDPSVLQYDLDSGDLRLFTAQDVYGTSTLTLRATDTADPSANISFVEFDLLVTVTSLNDAPIYQIGAYTNYAVDEDSGDIVVNLSSAFSDADLNDNTPGDEQLTYRLTIVDAPNEFVLTTLVNESSLNVISDDTPDGQDRTLVVETTASSIALPINADAHGELEITVRATDLGRPPAEPAAALPLFAQNPQPLRVTIQGIGDDQPAAVDDHYSDFPRLVIAEDSGPVFFDVGQNDYHGDAPIKVIIVGQTIIDSTGAEQALVSNIRLADPSDTGDFSIQFNGEVSCADQDCLDARRGSTTLSGSNISDTEIVYQPALNFSGEDFFTYCIEDGAPANEAPFNPPNDPRCATVTVNVTPVNDKPFIDQNIVITMEQADDLVVSEADGLKNFVRDIDNTHLDGQGCDPLLPSCVIGPGDPQPDRLYFYFAGAVTESGQLFAPFTDDGAFNYRPDATFAGEDSFDFQVCDTPTPGDADHCQSGSVSIQITPLEGAPEGSSDGAVQFDYQLAETPLELPIGPEPNVLIVNDDSGSMAWDVSTDGDSGVYQLASGHSLYFVNKATQGNDTYYHLAPAEKDAPGQGIWRLRSADFNTIYYNPAIRYKPWEGLDVNDVEFPDSPPTSARHNPLSSSPTTNLTSTIDFTGRAVITEPRVCETTCRRYRRGRCVSTRTTCSGGTRFTTVQSNGFYIPRYYEWTDLDGDETMDSTPSPANEDAGCATNRVLGCSEGRLVEIRNDGTLYPRGTKRTDCQTTTSSCTYDEEIQNFANWFTYYRSREFTAKAALGVVVANAENLRVGYAKLNSESNILPVESMNTSERTGAKAALLDAIYATNSSGGTPLRRSLRDAGRYFECKANDIFDSNSDTSAGNARCPVLPAPDGNCQQHFTLLITDGTWNGFSTFTGDSDGDNNSNFDGGAFAGSNFTTLADVAMLYYERDLHADLPNEVPTTSRDRALAADDAFENSSNELMHQHMTTYTVGFGVSGLVEENPVNYATGFNWGNPFSSSERKTDDVRHAAYNGRGEYLDASNAALLADKLVEAFDEFSQGSGAASAVSFNSQEIQEDTLIFRAFYNTKINTGDLIAQSLTDDGLLEEPVWSSADALDLQDPDSREIITYDAINSRGVPFRPATLNVDQKNAFISNQGATEAQKNAEVTQRVNYLRGDSTNERPVGNFRERPAINGRLGDIVHSTPVFIGGPNRSGRDQAPYPQANLYSAFRNTYTDRTDVIYVSSNDGMLHGFDASDGSEVFAFMPNNLMLGTFSRRITELLNFEYEHKFFVDLTPAINDVYMDSDNDGDKEWITFLIGGHGAGAKAYFALNVTDPNDLTETTASDVVLWEFTEEDDTYPTDSDGNPLLTGEGNQRQDLQDTPQPVKDLGYSFSVPTIAMSNLKDTNGEQVWVSVFGNGFNSTSGIAKLFVLFNDAGVDGTWCHPDMIHNEVLNGTLPAECIGKQDFVKLDTGFGVQDGFPNGLGTPRGIDLDGNGTIDYAYAGDTFGNLFRFDLTSDDYDDWSVTKIFEASYEDDLGNVTLQPITTQPIVTEHPTEADGFIVIFATGSYITVPDGRNKDIQSIYGLWDRLSPELLQVEDLVQQRYTNLFSAQFGNVRALSNNEVDYSVTGGKKGWYNHLDSVGVNGTQGIDDPEFPGEKAIRNIQLRGGLGFVNSVIPRSDTSCVDVAGGFALSFCPGTGGTNCLGNKGIFDLDNDGAFDAGDEVDGQVVAGTRFEDAVPTDSSFIEDKRITQLSDKSLDTTSTNTSGGENTGRLSWKELDSIE